MQRLTPNVTVLGNRHFNYFVIGSKEAALIECGTTAGAWIFKQHWQNWHDRPAISFMMAMHGHFDHICGIPALKEIMPHAFLLASRKCQGILSNPKIMAHFFDQDVRLTKKLVLEEMVPADLPATPAQCIEIDHIIDPGDIIRLGENLDLEVIYAPGHSPCSIACYLPQDKVMFLSDAAGFQITEEAIFPAFFQGYEMYIDTIRRLRQYPTQVLGLPHETIWRGDKVATFYDRALAAAENAFSAIQESLDQGLEDFEISSRLFCHYYQGDLQIYTPENIKICVDLLIKRVKECL